MWDEDERRWISEAEIAEIPHTAFASKKADLHARGRLIVRRVRRLNPATVPDGQGELFAAYRHHAFHTTNPLVIDQAEPMHRQHAVIEQVFSDLEDGPLGHLPSGKFQANAAWLTLAAISYNLIRAAGCSLAFPRQGHRRDHPRDPDQHPGPHSLLRPANRGCTCPSTGRGKAPSPPCGQGPATIRRPA